MGRVREHIKVSGRKCWTLFDTGARNTYVVPRVAALLTTKKLAKPFRTALGESKAAAILSAIVEGHRVLIQAMVVNQIGHDEDGKPIEIVFGALAMKQWGIRPVPDEERLDLTHYPKEFVEYFEWLIPPPVGPASRLTGPR